MCCSWVYRSQENRYWANRAEQTSHGFDSWLCSRYCAVCAFQHQVCLSCGCPRLCKHKSCCAPYLHDPLHGCNSRWLFLRWMYLPHSMPVHCKNAHVMPAEMAGANWMMRLLTWLQMHCSWLPLSLGGATYYVPACPSMSYFLASGIECHELRCCYDSITLFSYSATWLPQLTAWYSLPSCSIAVAGVFLPPHSINDAVLHGIWSWRLATDCCPSCSACYCVSAGEFT